MSHYGPPQAAWTVAPLPRHPASQKALVLGIIALGGTFVLVLPIFLSPYAWYFGAKVKRDIAAAPDRWSSSSDANAGMILGIIGSALLVIVVILLMLAAVGLGILTHEHTYY